MSQSSDVPPKAKTQPRSPTPPPQSEEGAPVEQQKAEKPRYSKDLKGLQKLERGVSRSGHRMARAVEGAMREWRKQSKKSARKKRDGAIRDSLENSVKAMTYFAREASWAPVDFIKVVKPKVRPIKVFAGLIAPFIP